MKKLKKNSLKHICLRVMRAEGDPPRIARGVAVGLFANFAIPVGAQVFFSIVLAFIFRGAKIPAVTLTFITNFATAAVIYPFQCYIGGLLVGRPLSMPQIQSQLRLFMEEARQERYDWNVFKNIGGAALELVHTLGWDFALSFMAGGVLLGVVTAVPGYFISLRMAENYKRAKAERQKRGALRRKQKREDLEKKTS